MLCFQKTGAEIGEFLTPLIFLCHSYKKWTLQFLPNHNETLLKGGVHVYLIFTKFHNNWIKIVDFLIKGHFWSSPV